MEFIFLFIFIAILYSLHFIVYYFLIYGFDIKNRRKRLILRIIFLFLPLSFIISSILISFSENILTKFIYIIAGLWIGLLFNLLAGIFIFWAVWTILRLLKINFNVKLFSVIVLIFAFIYMGFGIYNVYNPQVKNIAIKIKDLPPQWQGKKIIQLSDLHLGRVLGENFLETIVEKVNSLDAEAVVITGDLFDGMGSNVEKYSSMLDSLKARQGVYFVTGNHETYLGTKDVLEAISKTKITVLDDRIVNVGGLQIIGISFTGFGENKDVKEIFNKDKNFNQKDPAILLYHTPSSIFTEETSNHSDIYFSPNIDFEAVSDLGIDLQLSGHTHRGQIFPFNFVTKMVYGVYDYGLHYYNDLAVYTSSGAGVWGPTMRTASRSEIVEITLY